MNKIRVKNAVFDGISGGEKSGVFNINSKQIFVFSSLFNKCTATKYGGCIYALKSFVNLETSFFLNCCVKTSNDSCFGNALYCTEANATEIDHISTRLCGQNDMKGGSAIRMEKGLQIIKCYNASDNYGIYGASLYSSSTCNEGSY